MGRGTGQRWEEEQGEFGGQIRANLGSEQDVLKAAGLLLSAAGEEADP